MDQNREMFTKASYPVLLLHLCAPAIVIMLVMVVYNMADTYFIGQTGDASKIAAVSLCGPVFTILSGLGTLLGSGGCTAISLAYGKKNLEKSRKYSSFCCYGALAVGVSFSIIVLPFQKPLVNLLGADQTTMPDMLDYLRILALGSPAVMFCNVFANVIRADGSARESMIANCLGTVVNILLDALFILAFSWDVAGAALATVIGNCVSSGYLLHYIIKKKPMFSLHPSDFCMNKDISLKVLSLGLPMAFSTLLMSFSHMLSNRMVVDYGSVALAAQGVSGKIGMPITMIAMGICMGMQPAVSFLYGAGNLKRMKQVLFNTSIFTIAVGSILTAICFFARDALVAAFIQDEEVISYGQIMVFASIATGPIYGLYQVCQTFLQSTGKASYATFVAILDKGLFFIPALFILRELFGLYGIVFAGTVTVLFSLAMGAMLSFIWHRKINKDEIPS